jgi:hypothetical protein
VPEIVGVDQQTVETTAPTLAPLRYECRPRAGTPGAWSIGWIQLVQERAESNDFSACVGET